MTRYFKFILCDGSPVTSSFSLSPVNFPIASNGGIATGDVLTFNGSQSLDLVDNFFKIELNRKASNDWFISLSGSANPTASANIVSGSYITGSVSTVYFSFIDHDKNPLGIHAVEIKPLGKNIGFNDSFILEDSVTYLTDGTGTLSVSLVPQSYIVTLKGDRKNTCFTILPCGSAVTASQVIVGSANVSPNITVKNSAFYAYTAVASDARYALKTDAAATASYLSGSGKAFDLTVTDRLTVGSVVDTGYYALNDVGGVNSVNWGNRILLDGDGNYSVDWQNRELIYNDAPTVDWGSSFLKVNGATSVDWGNHILAVNNYPMVDWSSTSLNVMNGNTVLNWGGAALYDVSPYNYTSLDWHNRILYDNSGSVALSYGNGVTVNGPISALASVNNGAGLAITNPVDNGAGYYAVQLKDRMGRANIWMRSYSSGAGAYTGEMYVNNIVNVGYGTYINGSTIKNYYNGLLTIQDNGGTTYFGGRIGVGNSTPSASIHVSGSSNSGLLQIASPTSQNLLFVSGSGNIGIGTGTPAARLHISSSASGTNDSFLVTNGAGTKLFEIQDNGTVNFPNTVGSNANWQPASAGGNGILWLPPNSIIMSNLISSFWGNDLQINNEASFWCRFNSGNNTGKKFAIQANSAQNELLTILSGGNVGISNTNPQSALDVTGDIAATGKLKLYNSSTPASSTATGVTGQVTWDTNYIYVCTATNQWKRASLSTW